MHGSIVVAMKNMVKDRFGADTWREALTKAGFSSEPLIMSISVVEDKSAFAIVGALCEVCKMSLTQLADAFGEYWVNVYSQEMYSAYFRGHNDAKSFLQSIDDIHVRMMKKDANAHPPRFTFDWKDEQTVVMTYASTRNMIDFAVGLIKGVGKFYKQQLKVTHLGQNRIEVVFPQAAA